MSQDVNQHTKLGEIYNNLSGVNMTVEDMDLPVSVYNYLKRGGINQLTQLLLMCEADLMNLSGARRNFPYLIFWLEEQSRKRQRTESAGDTFMALARQVIPPIPHF